MSLTERLAEPKKDRGGPKCALCVALGTLDDEEREAVETALADGRWSARNLSEVLRDEWQDPAVKKSTVENHRREHMG